MLQKTVRDRKVKQQQGAKLGQDEKMDLRVESSRKFNKILQKTKADSEKSQNYKIEL